MTSRTCCSARCKHFAFKLIIYDYRYEISARRRHRLEAPFLGGRRVSFNVIIRVWHVYYVLCN